MKLTSNPFSVYDFLGYFLSGFICLYFINFGVTNNIIDFDTLKQLKLDYSKTKSEFDFLFIIVISYICGHAISFISSITIEQYNIFVYKYPSKYLLKKNNIKPGIKSYYSEKGLVKNLLRTILLIIVFPLLILDIIFGHFFGFIKYFTRPFSNELIELIQYKINSILKLKFCNYENNTGVSNLEDYFLPVYHCIISNSEKHYQRAQNYVTLYGFLRNLTLISLILCWLSIYNFDPSEPKFSLIILSFPLLSTYVFFLGYLKFFRRFTKEIILGTLSINECD